MRLEEGFFDLFGPYSLGPHCVAKVGGIDGSIVYNINVMLSSHRLDSLTSPDSLVEDALFVKF